MQKLGGFFEKFQGKIASQVKSLVLVMEIVKKHTGVDVDMKNISISSGNLYLKTSSAEKNEIFIKKEKILKELKEKARFLPVKDIR